MKLGWYLNRLRNMEPAEILHRLVEKQRKLVSQRRDDGWARYPARELHPVFPGWRKALLAASQAQRDAIGKAAEDALEGRFAALGREWQVRHSANLFPKDFWRLDPITGTLWPGAEAHTFAVDFRHAGDKGDIKYVWEANRLQTLPVLAAHGVLSGDARTFRAIEDAIASWHEANPPFRGVAWASGIEVALRAISLIATLDIAGERLSEDTRTKAGAILAASLYWLARFPSRFSSANNHWVAELAGEFLIGLAFGEQGEAARGGLIAETTRQILPDGLAAEQSPTYGAFTAELILLCAAAADFAGRPLPQPALARLAAFADAATWLPAEASYGDDDEGRALTLGNEADYVSSVASAIRGFVSTPAGGSPNGDFRALLLGTPQQAPLKPAGLKTFADGGLTVWRGAISGRQVELTFDHGPLGYLSIAAHGHADALAVALWLDGMPVLVDPGTFLYGSGGVWRDWFRSTPAHNTLNIAGASQSIMSGKFNWSHKATTRLVETAETPDWRISAVHDGYANRFGVRHQRSVAKGPHGITITDRLLGKAQHAEIVFQLAPGHMVKQEGASVTVARANEPLLVMRFPDASLEIRSGGEQPGQGGWFSPRFGERVPAERLAWRGTVSETGVVTEIEPLAPAGGER